MKLDIAGISNTHELVDAYVTAHNKFWNIEDDLKKAGDRTEAILKIE